MPEERANQFVAAKAALGRRSKFQKTMTCSLEEVGQPVVQNVDVDMD
jgi:hypothetical protein